MRMFVTKEVRYELEMPDRQRELAIERAKELIEGMPVVDGEDYWESEPEWDFDVEER